MAVAEARKLEKGESTSAGSTNGRPEWLFSIGWTRTDGRKLWFFWSAQGGNAHLPGLASATLYDPLHGTQTPVSGTNGLTVPVKSNLQILLWE